MSLNAYTRKLAKDSGKRPTEIAALAGTSEGWAKLYLAGKITSPGVDTIERLYVALTGKPLLTPEDS